MDNLPDKINVLIQNQPWSVQKYACSHCYLHDALKNMGFLDITVFGEGHTSIGKQRYKPSFETPFNGSIVKDNLEAGKDIFVTLIKK